MGQRLAIDIGGTFTDLVALDEATGEITLQKALTTPRRFSDGVIDTVRQSKLEPERITQFVHGTTVVINALTERLGARVALITTRGFRDVLEIQRANRTDMYNLFYEKPRPFVRRRYRFEVTERVNHRGDVLIPLDEDDVATVARLCAQEEIEAIAVCFLHAYANPTHELRTREILESEYPEASLTLSHEITQEWREYERTNTTVMNAYVKPTTSRYLAELDRELSAMGLACATYSMQSNGGTTTFAQAQRVPIHLVESGPVGGVIGAGAVAAAIGEQNLISFDMGGTTAKASLIDQGRIVIDTHYYLEKTATWAGYPLRIPVVDIVEVGAGGGSVAWIDGGGALHVGPRSAGADPGPASYDLGGTEPTVTDANLVTGRLSAEYFLGGRMKLNVANAETAIGQIAESLGLSTTETALGILRLTNANMQAALERVSIERGYDPRDFALVASGGAGPLHGTALARELQLRKVIVPPAPGQFSAWGMLMTDLRHDFIRTHILTCETGKLDEIRREFERLEKEAAAQYAAEGFPPERVSVDRLLDLRYRGQEHTVRTPIEAIELEAGRLADVASRFHDLHEQAYSFRQDDPIEIVNFHVTAWGSVDKPTVLPQKSESADMTRAVKGSRLVVFEGDGAVRSNVYERSLLPIGQTIAGPAVIEEAACTTIIYPDQRAMSDEYGNLVVVEAAS
ncbi:hydantoinase/oxoprolinase family protein [Candidatus Bipolaricaulota bacterium]